VACESVCRPIEYGGHGISNLKNLGWALRARWLWLQKTEPRRPWSALDIQVPGQVQAFFSVAINTDGESTYFGLIDGYKEEKLQTWLLYSLLPFHKQGESATRCSKPSKTTPGLLTYKEL
jgi:hypothetical protein